MTTTSFEDRSFFGGLSLSVRDTLQNVILLSSLDVRLTLTAIGLSAFCTTRRREIWSVRYLLIEDIFRLRGGREENGGGGGASTDDSTFAAAVGGPQLVIAYEAPLPPYEYSGVDERATSLSLGHNYRHMEATIHHTNGEFVEEIFHMILPRWSFKQIKSTESCAVLGTSNGCTGRLREERTPRRQIDFHPSSERGVGAGGRREGGGGEGSGARVERAPVQPTQCGRYDISDLSPTERYARGCISAPKHHPPKALPQHLSDNFDDDVMDFTGTDEAFEELAAIQHRRRERQRLLVSHLHDGGSLSALRADSPAAQGSGGLSLSGDYRYRSLGLSRPDRGTGYGTGSVSIEEAYALCPYCNKHGGVQHLSECQLRPVDCSWCGQRMRFAEFPYHAAICRPLAQRPPPAPAVSSPPVRAKGKSAPPPQVQKPLEEPDGRRCIWCDRVRPKSHDPECSERKFACGVCHKVVLLRDKKSHRSICQLRDNPQKSEATTVS